MFMQTSTNSLYSRVSVFHHIILKVLLSWLAWRNRDTQIREGWIPRKRERDHQREYKALDLFKYTLVWEMVRKIRFDSVGDFQNTLEFHSEQKSCREITWEEERWRRRKQDWSINGKLAGVDLREIRFYSDAEGGKIGIILQICGKYCLWKSERWKKKGGGGGVVKMRRNFVKGDGVKLFCFGTDCWLSIPLHPTLCSPLQPSSLSPQCVKDPINNSQSHPGTQKTTGHSPAAVSFQCSPVRAAVWSSLEAEKHH